MARKNKEEIQPIEASFDDVSNAIVVPTVVNEIPLQAIRKGNFQKKFGFDCDCYVLNDEKHTAVITQRGMARVLGMSDRGNSLINLVQSKSIAGTVADELSQKIHNPLIFNPNTVADSSKFNKAHGYDVVLLIDLCRAIIQANEEGKLAHNQRHIARQAQIIINASAKSGIQGLVYAITGYDATKEEIIQGFNKFLIEEMSRDYAQEFPPELYFEWSRIYNFPVRVGRNHHVKCRWLTIDHVYIPLLRSNGTILRLLKEKKRNDYNGNCKKLFQYLNEEAGAPALRKHLQQLLAIATTAKGNREKYEEDFNTLFGMQLQFDFSKLEESN